MMRFIKNTGTRLTLRLGSIALLVSLLALVAACSPMQQVPKQITQLPDQTEGSKNLDLQEDPAGPARSPNPTDNNPSGAGQVNPAPLQSETSHVPLLPQAQSLAANLDHAPRYHLALNVDPSNHRFSGLSRLTYTNQEDTALDRLYFRLLPNGKKSYGNGSLKVDSLIIEGKVVEPLLSQQDTVLEVPLSAALDPGAQTEIVFTFSGNLPVDFAGDPEKGEGGYGIYSSSKGVISLAGWYPILAVYDHQGWNLDPVSAIGDSVYSDTAFYTVDLTTPKEVVVAATGVIEVEQESGDRITRRYASGPARDFALVMSPDFERHQSLVDGVTVTSYSLPGHASAGETALGIASDSLRLYNSLFGAYPYTEFDIVEAPMRYALGVEFPGLVQIRSSLYEDPEEPVFITTISHEVAHQWWYNLVGNDVFEEPWLDEGLTTYSSVLQYESDYGSSAADGYLDYLESSYAQAKSNGHDAPVNSSLSFFEQQGLVSDYAAIIYHKGALFFDAVRDRLGDSIFFEALQRYYQEYQFGIATTDDLLRIFEETAGEQLDDFYNQWLDTTVLNVGGSSSSSLDESQSLTFAVIGDFGSGDQNARAVSDLVKSWNPDLIITNNYPVGSRDSIDTNVGQFYADYIGSYQGDYGPGAETNAFYPTPGNHDWDSEGLQPYLDYFTLPGNEYYYDFTAGPVHFFALDTDSRTADGVGKNSIQAQWLKEKLAASDAVWKVVYGHVPPYSSGTHGSVDWIRWPFKEWGATIYLSGHDHLYERLEVDGFPYIINGLGGGAIYYFNQPLPGSLKRFTGEYGAMLVMASASEITFRFISMNGEVVDTLTIQK